MSSSVLQIILWAVAVMLLIMYLKRRRTRKMVP